MVTEHEIYSNTLFCYSGSAPKSEAHANFLADVKKALGAKKSAELFQAIYNYKKTDNYEKLVSTVVSLFTEKDEDLTLLVSKLFDITTYIYIILNKGGLARFLCELANYSLCHLSFLKNLACLFVLTIRCSTNI